MKDPELRYFPTEDILHIRFAPGDELDCQLLSGMVTAEIGEHGKVIGLEIEQASKWLQQLQEVMGQTQPLAGTQQGGKEA